MINNNNNLDELDLINNEVSNLVKAWLRLMSKQQFDLADTLCFIFIAKYKKTLKTFSLTNRENDYYVLHSLLVLFKGMQDYVELEKLTQDNTWHKKQKIVEEIWIKKCDCKDRLEFVSANFRGEVIEKISKEINNIETFFKQVFGKGYYLSPGIICDKFICNICNQDTRACSHIHRRLYAGILCKYKPINPQINHIALVEDPKDLRCRIWPWNIDKNNNPEVENRTLESVFLTAFSVDDFLREKQ
ncbi:hypothetical protein [Dolichospermum heterosporum]|uniref:Uncharacterized protein n=1 Tax=Dolichospermum heterosporum TAC447 TaxID=747523 RepID=A0ABY5LYM0_9CYAN|nr:hypothetical protein [Dolichospermum heterosporum]UUO16370.1 hypothetical protein NG743_04800 [Dolichospermum heterosporum TAC447]